MKRILRLTFTISLLLTSTTLYSQKYSNNWHINDFDLIFQDDTVEVCQGISIKENSGVGIISDYEGNLLFYSDGHSVWNKNHDLMPNGIDLGILDSRASLVVPKPDSESLYYLFTVDGKSEQQDSSGLYYSVIDLSLEDGLGDVTTKSIKLLDNTTQTITAVSHANNHDVWIVTQQYGLKKYYSILLTKNGISGSYVESNVGTINGDGFSDPQLKSSPDGKKIASGNNSSNTNGFDLFDFDASNGTLSNTLSFDKISIGRYCAGIEFSSDASKLYVLMGGSIGEGRLLQYDLSEYNYEDINSSVKPVLIPQKTGVSQLQLASNGKIYFAKGGGDYSGTEYLGVVNRPNEPGNLCNAVELGLYLEGRNCIIGRTPNFIQNYFFRTNITTNGSCQSAPVSFNVTNEYKLDSVRWYFGEGSTSTQVHPVFIYDNSGKYTVQLLAYYPEKCDTITKQITINPYTAFDLGDNSTVCYGNKISVPGNFESYLWNDGDTVNYNFIEQNGWYKTTVTNNFGCMSSDSIYMTVVDLPVITTLPDTIVLEDQDSVKLDPGDFTTYKWSTGDTTDFLYVKDESWYSVFVENESGCHSSKSVLVMQQPGTENENSNDWKIVNPQPNYLTGLDVCFINERTGFIINNNSLLKTNNGGNSWEKVMTLSSANRISFNNSIGYIIGNGGTIYKSTHEGGGWNKLNTNFTDNLNSITLVTEDTIRITSSNNLFSSNNGGYTWEIAPINGGLVNDSYFISSNEGYAACNDGTILKTLDGGESWTKKLSTNTFPSDFFRIVFTNDSVGFATREHREIFKTTDRGENWQRIKSLDAIYDMHFLDNETGYLSGEHGVIYKTTDGGSNWQYISPTVRIYAYDLYGVFFTNENEGYATGARGRILKTTNGGNTWDEYAPTYIDIKQLDFISDSIAYMLVGNEIYKTTDGGKTILNMGAPLSGEKTRQFDFIDELTGYSISGGETGTSSSENSVCKTIDGGKTWVKTHDSYRVMDDLYCLDFIDENTGFVSGGYNQPQLKKTTDGGKTWTTKGESLRFGQIQFINSETGYARNTKNYYHRIYKTIDGGENWEIIFEMEEGINSLYFIDASTGFIVGDNGLIYKTVDGGENWKKLSIPYEYYVYVKFISKNIGFILDEDGKLYKTADGGENWELWTQLHGINAVEIQKEKIYISGTYGKILENSIMVDSVSVHINLADSISNTSALISGTATSNGGMIDSVVFEYSDDRTFSNKIVLDIAINYDSSAFVSTMLSQLKSNTNYLYRLYAVQGDKKYYSDIGSFSTLNNYEIKLDYVYDYSSDQAKVTGQVISRDTSITDIEFQYSTDNSFENSISATPNTLSANETATVEAILTSLNPETKYYVRLKANYRGQIIYSSSTTSFTTPPEYKITMYSPNVNEKSLTIQGYISAFKDNITNLIIQYGKSTNYDLKAAAVPNTIHKGQQQFFECQLSDLDSNTVYLYRPCFVMGTDTVYGDENIISLNQELDIVILGAEEVSDSAVLVKAIVNSYKKSVYDIKFMYGIGGEFTDSIYSNPSYVSYNSTAVQATINGLIPNSEYTFKLSAIYNSNRIYSDTTSFFLSGTTGIMRQNRLSDVNIYPNPTEQFVTIKCSNPVSYIELRNLQGIVLIKSDNLELDMSEFPSGVYIVKVFFNKEFVTRKIIKK